MRVLDRILDHYHRSWKPENISNLVVLLCSLCLGQRIHVEFFFPGQPADEFFFPGQLADEFFFFQDVRLSFFSGLLS